MRRTTIRSFATVVSRALLLAGGLLLAVALPRSTRAETFSVETIRFPGFRVETRDAIGCESTGHFPSAEAAAVAAKGQREALESRREMLRRAYTHFVAGKHPYTRFLRYLAPEAARGLGDLAAGRLPSTAEIALGPFYFYLTIDAATPPAVREKLIFDFVLAQAFEGGVLRDPASRSLLWRGGRAMDVERLGSQLAHLDPQFSFHFSPIIAVAAANPEALERLASASTDAGWEERSTAVRAAALRTFLGQGRLDDEFLRRLEPLSPTRRFFETRLLILLSPLTREDRAVLLTFVRQKITHNRDFLLATYGALLR